MTQNASQERNLVTVTKLLDELFKANRYGAFAASATGTYAFSMAGTLLDIHERNIQLSELDRMQAPPTDRRRESIGNRIKDLEQRLDRTQELYSWFRSIAANEGMQEFMTTKAKDVFAIMGNPQVPEMSEIEHHAKVLNCTLPEAKATLEKERQDEAKAVKEAESELIPQLQRKLDGLKTKAKLAKLLAKFNVSGNHTDTETVFDLDDFEARRLAEHIEAKADQYASRVEDQINRSRGRTARQRRYKEGLGATRLLLMDIVKQAGKFADELTHRIDAGEKREGEEQYDTDHGTTQQVA